MPRVYVLVGEDNTRKSSIIRALTGARIRDQYRILTTSGTIDAYVEVVALQERPISPQDFMNQVGHNQNILIPLRIQATNNCPGWIDYLNAFLSNSWTISQIVALETTPFQGLPQSFPLPLYIPSSGSRQIPINQLASQVRNHW